MDLTHLHLSAWRQREEHAEAIVPLAGALYRKRALVAAVFGTSLVQKTPIEILRIFKRADRFAGRELVMGDAVTLLRLMTTLALGRARVDIGKLLVRYQAGDHGDLEAWATANLAPLTAAPRTLPREPQDVVLYGFGRVGRLIARILIGKTGGGDKHRLRAIVLRPPGIPDLARRASLLRLDSVHGPFAGTVEVDEENNAIIANGNLIRVLYADRPEDLDYAQYGIQNAVVIDNTGKWRDREGLAKHLACPGAARVILTAPGKGDVPNLVYGVNHAQHAPDETIYSAASCTTNAIVPVLKVVLDAWGIRRGHIETIHAYTNDQNLIDNFHKKDRRGRSAPLNMVITSTGAATASAKALPELEGKLTGSAIRVPTPNVSLAILQLELEAEVSGEIVNEHLREVAMDSPLESQIYYAVSPEIVSTDLVGNHHAAIVDSDATIVRGKNAVLYVWYDNEYGYACQVMRLMQYIVGIEPKVFPPPLPVDAAEARGSAG